MQIWKCFSSARPVCMKSEIRLRAEASSSVKLSNCTSHRGCRIARQVLYILRRFADSRLPSSGIRTRANYPSPPLKLRQNLLRRRIGAPRPPVLPVQQPGMPPSAAELVFKRRPRLERVATLRAPRPRVFPVPRPFAHPALTLYPPIYQFRPVLRDGT